MLVGLTIVLGAAKANATLINFDTLPGGGAVANNTRIGHQYAPMGVTFSLFENGDLVGNPLATSIGGSHGAGSGNGLYNVFADVLLIDFTTPVTNVSFDTYGFFRDDTSFNFLAYDTGDSLLETITNTDGGLMTVSFNGGSVARIEVLQENELGTYRIDDLSFQPASAPVPEPGTWMLMSTGLIGLLGYGWRKRQRQIA
jgi:hypothetical protein